MAFEVVPERFSFSTSEIDIVLCKISYDLVFVSPLTAFHVSFKTRPSYCHVILGAGAFVKSTSTVKTSPTFPATSFALSLNG